MEAQAKKIFDSILERAGTGDTLRNPVAADWFKDWIASKEANNAASTAVRYKQIVEEFVEHLGLRAKRPLSAVAPRDVETFLAKRKKAGCSPTTINQDGKILRAAFEKAHKQGVIILNPAAAIDLPEKDSVERGTFNAAEVKMLVNVARGEWKTLILLGYYTGARLSDCCRMEWKDVDLAAGVLSYVQRKTGKLVHVPLHPELQICLEKLAISDKPQIFVMPGMADKGPGGRHGLSESF